MALAHVRSLMLATVLSFLFAACAQEPSDPPGGIDLPGFSPAERAWDLALADLSAMADNLALLERGEIDEAAAVLRLRDIRAHAETFRPDWRNASPAARAAARERLGDAWMRIETRYAAHIAAFEALPAPRSVKLGALLLEPSPLAEFRREPPIEVLSGIFRAGFEASDFRALDGRGPYWLIAGGEPWEQIRAIAPQGGGRGAYITVALELEGWIEDVPGTRYGHLGGYDAELHVESVRSVRVLSSEDYEAVLETLMRSGQ